MLFVLIIFKTTTAVHRVF